MLPNGGWREQRERGYRSSLPLCFPPLTAIFSHSKLSPPFSFPALSPVFKNSSPSFQKNSPPGKLIVSGIHRHKWSGAAACAWGAGDTKPGQPALLPRLRCSPLLRVSGSDMHMGGTLSTLFWFFLIIFLFLWGSKNGLQQLSFKFSTNKRQEFLVSLYLPDKPFHFHL